MALSCNRFWPASGGHPRTVNIRLILNTIFYLTKTGCQWRMLPKDLAKRSSTHAYFSRWQRDGTWQALLDASGRLQVCPFPSREGLRGHSCRLRLRSPPDSAERSENQAGLLRFLAPIQ